MDKTKPQSLTSITSQVTVTKHKLRLEIKAISGTFVQRDRETDANSCTTSKCLF